MGTNWGLGAKRTKPNFGFGAKESLETRDKLKVIPPPPIPLDVQLFVCLFY